MVDYLSYCNQCANGERLTGGVDQWLLQLQACHLLRFLSIGVVFKP